jgi:hypothetical protein
VALRRTVALAALTLVYAAPSVAQEDGVHYEGDSPAGREYAVPLDDARRPHSDSNPRGAARGGSAPELFGRGITADPSPGGAEVPRKDSPRAPSGTGSGGPSGVPTDLPERANSRQRAKAHAIARSIETPVSAKEAGSTLGFSVAAIAAAVLLLGGGTGLALRRARGDS